MQDSILMFLALLALGCALFVLGALVCWVAAGLGRPAALDALTAAVGPYAFTFAAAVTVVATTGSLWLSDSLPFLSGPGYPPCKLCWYQRIAMYPLAPIAVHATWLRHRAPDGRAGDQSARVYLTGGAVVGALISTWHVLVERFPSLETTTSCDPTNPCSIRWVEELGFVTIPMMAGAGFLTVIALMAVSRHHDRSQVLF